MQFISFVSMYLNLLKVFLNITKGHLKFRSKCINKKCYLQLIKDCDTLSTQAQENNVKVKGTFIRFLGLQEFQIHQHAKTFHNILEVLSTHIYGEAGVSLFSYTFPEVQHLALPQWQLSENSQMKNVVQNNLSVTKNSRLHFQIKPIRV